MTKRKDSFTNDQLDQVCGLMSKILEKSRDRLEKEPASKDLIKRLNADMNELREYLS